MTDIKQLLKVFEHFAYGQSKHTAFTELLDWTLLPFKKFDSAEQQNQALETYQNHPKVTQLVKLLAMGIMGSILPQNPYAICFQS
jgi:hypothetical protein